MESEIERIRSIERARDIILDAADRMENGVVVLDQYAPQDALKEVPDAKFVVFPSNRGGYNIQTIPTENQKVGRVLFPEEWLGNPDKSLGMTFCHPGNFIASTETLEQAVNVANIAMEKESQQTDQQADCEEADLEEEETEL